MISTVTAICAALSPTSTVQDGDPPALLVAKPDLPVSATLVSGFVPGGWMLERSVAGDLNRDGRADVAAILKGADPNCIVQIDGNSASMDTNPRILLIAFGEAGGYRLHLANAAVIPRLEDRYMDDPLDLDAFAIRGNVLRLGLGFWRSMGGWTTYTSIFSFRWNGRRFALIGFDQTSLQRNSGETESVSANFVTNRARITTGSMEDDVQDQTRWERLPAQSLSLETMGDGLAFELKRAGKRKAATASLRYLRHFPATRAAR